MNNAANTFRFNTTEYQLSHGKTPRGRGSWVFSVRREPGDKLNDPKVTFWSPSTTYAAAKKLARAHFTNVVGSGHLSGPFVLHVLP